MFCKLSLLALVAPLASALQLQVPQNPTTGGSVTLKWTAESGDPARFSTFSFELLNEVFHNAYAIANNVDPSLGEITIVLPAVPVGDGYTLQAVNIGNITDVYASTSSFSIGASSASVTSGSSTASGSSTSSVSRSSSSGVSTSVVTPTTAASTSAPASGGTSGSGSAPAPFNSNSAAIAVTASLNFGGLAIAVLSAAAGAAMIAL